MSAPLQLYIHVHHTFSRNPSDDGFGLYKVTRKEKENTRNEYHTFSRNPPDEAFAFKVLCNENNNTPCNENNNTRSKYEISKFENIWKGSMSQICDIKLPLASMKGAGIPHRAAKFAYLYPPGGLHDEIDSSEVHTELQGNEDDFRAMHFFSILGGFVYFDINSEVIAVNTLSMIRTGSSIHLSGPFYDTDDDEIVEDVCERLNAKKETILFDIFHEVGISQFAWVMPNESFQGRKVRDNIHGALIFIREDGSTVYKYLVTPQLKIQQQGKMDFINDMFYTLYTSVNGSIPQKEACLRKKDEKFEFEKLKEIRKSKEFKTDPYSYENDVENGVKNWEFGRNVFHLVCRFGTEKTEIEKLLERYPEPEHLKKQDDFTWTPLHYLCRFGARRKKETVEILQLLLNHASDIVHIKDDFNRYPLHIACDSNQPKEFLENLLEYEKLKFEKEEVSIRTKTKHLKLLPLHICLTRNASKDVIELLLNEDNIEGEGEDRTVHTACGIGRNPLTIAICNNRPAAIIEVLLNAETNESKNIESNFRGMQPIHIACWKSYCKEVVKKLLYKGEHKENQLKAVATGEILQFLGLEDFSDDGTSASTRNTNSGNQSTKNSYESVQGSVGDGKVRGSLPIHFALDRGVQEIYKLLLDEQHSKKEISDFINRQVDNNDRCPIHVACLKNLSQDVFDKVFHEDTCCRQDGEHMLPLHYACNHKEVQVNIVKRLTQYAPENDFDKFHSPLFEAVISDAPDSVVEELMSNSNYFNLQGFTDALINDLSQRVKKNTALQKAVNNRLSDRLSFCLLMTDLFFWKIVPFICLLVYSEMLMVPFLQNGTANVILVNTDATKISAFFMFISFASKLIWEAVKFKFLGIDVAVVEFLLKPKKCLDMLATLCLISCWWTLKNREEEIEKNKAGVEEHEAILFQTTAIILVIVIVVSFRKTFHPFASIVGGIITIMQMLFPFFMVSTLVLFLFTFIYRVRVIALKDHDENVKNEVEENCETDHFGKCLRFVYFGFFHGFDSPSNRIDLFFGVVVTIILLTVVIAIVDDAWEQSKKKTDQVFWEGRLSFIAEVPQAFRREFAKFENKYPWFKKFLKSIDETDPINITFGRLFGSDKIHWHKESPYNEVDKFEVYAKPHNYFEEEMANKISATHCLQSDIYWIKYDYSHLGDNERSIKKYFFKIFRSLLNRSIRFLGNVLMIFFTSLTGGILWPRYFRTWIVSYGVDTDDYKQET